MPDAQRRGFLEALSPGAHQALVGQARRIRVRKGQTVLARGQAPGDVFVVQTGRLHVLLYAASGREVSLRDLTEGQLFGELSAMDGVARSVGVVAAADSQLLAIGSAVFRTAIRDYPEAADWLIRRLSAQVRSLTDRVFEMSALSVRARLYCELTRLARSSLEQDTALTHEELANRIGSHREAVTRELAILAEQKIIRLGRRRIEFLDSAALEAATATCLRSPVGDESWW